MTGCNTAAVIALVYSQKQMVISILHVLEDGPWSVLYDQRTQSCSSSRDTGWHRTPAEQSTACCYSSAAAHSTIFHREKHCLRQHGISSIDRHSIRSCTAIQERLTINSKHCSATAQLEPCTLPTTGMFEFTHFLLESSDWPYYQHSLGIRAKIIHFRINTFLLAFSV